MIVFDEDGAGPMPPSLFVGNDGWSSTGGPSNPYVARYGCIPCYPNCDASTAAPVLNVLDFGCFLNQFASGNSYANCDSSTTPPILTVADFACFLNAFAAGCS
jgi:hypothetical protein